MPTEPALAAALAVERLERLSRAAAASSLNPAQWDALRYLVRANRFSRTPAALAAFLGSTRGTVTRTLDSLEAKGLVRREPSPRDGRGVDLSLTARARAALAGDPAVALAADIDRATGAGVAGLARALDAVLAATVARAGSPPFGVCRDCIHFRGGTGARAGRCALLDAPLSADDSAAICAEQVPRGT